MSRYVVRMDKSLVSHLENQIFLSSTRGRKQSGRIQFLVNVMTEQDPAEAAPLSAAAMRPTAAPVAPTRSILDRAGALAGDLWARTGIQWRRRCKADGNRGGASIAHTTGDARLR